MVSLITLSVKRRSQTGATAFIRCTAVGTAKGRKAEPALPSKIPLPVMKTGSTLTGSGTPTLGHPLGALMVAGKKAGIKGGISDQTRLGSAVNIHVEYRQPESRMAPLPFVPALRDLGTASRLVKGKILRCFVPFSACALCKPTILAPALPWPEQRFCSAGVGTLRCLASSLQAQNLPPRCGSSNCVSAHCAGIHLGQGGNYTLSQLYLLHLAVSGSMAAEFFSLMTDSSIPDNIREALASYDMPRSCNNQDELAALISHLMEASGSSAVGDQILARASVRLLFSRCRESCGLPPLDEAKGSQQPAGPASSSAAPPAHTSNVVERARYHFMKHRTAFHGKEVSKKKKRANMFCFSDLT